MFLWQGDEYKIKCEIQELYLLVSQKYLCSWWIQDKVWNTRIIFISLFIWGVTLIQFFKVNKGQLEACGVQKLFTWSTHEI